MTAPATSGWKKSKVNLQSLTREAKERFKSVIVGDSDEAILTMAPT